MLKILQKRCRCRDVIVDHECDQVHGKAPMNSCIKNIKIRGNNIRSQHRVDRNLRALLWGPEGLRLSVALDRDLATP